ncbi:MAG: OmpA family protein, partial [Proteobacteria bacterium]|nr:OmpA family protein [Pseudomonadota bacterium]
AGSSETISWDQPRGVYHCSLVIRARNASGAPVSLQADHEFTSSAGIDLLVNLRELSPEVNDITLRATQPMVKAHVVVTADDGTRIDEVTRAVSPPSKEAKISWQKSSLQPALIDIRIEDAFGMWATGTVFYYQIPHTDIVFDTGKSVVRPDQAPYLQESLTEIKAVLGRYQHVAMDLYISGFTDTVGSMASNDKLSLDRARAIAQWFRANGVSIAVYYRGLGERVLAVQTPDETDNAQNRRATYVLSNSAPTDHTELQGGKWQKL